MELGRLPAEDGGRPSGSHDHDVLVPANQLVD
jgi:hypothetical protein